MLTVIRENKLITEKLNIQDKYNKQYKDSKLSLLEFEALVKMDPTSKGDIIGDYCDFIVRLYTKLGEKELLGINTDDGDGSLLSVEEGEDAYKLKVYLKRYFEIMKKPSNVPVEFRDINKFRNLADLGKALEAFLTEEDYRALGQDKSVSWEVDWVDNMFTKSGGAEVLLNKGGWVIVNEKTPKAAEYYGRETSWCIAYKDDPGYFNRYSKINKIIFIGKKTGNKEDRWQFYWGDPTQGVEQAQWKNIHNGDLNLMAWREKHESDPVFDDVLDVLADVDSKSGV